MASSVSTVQGDPVKTGSWSNGLFGCFNNMGLCVVTFFVPCITFGQVAEAHGDSCGLYGLLYIVPLLNCYLESQYRDTIMQRRGIASSFVEEFVKIFFCPPCTLTQESMEIREIQAEEARIGAMMGGAPPSAFAASQPYIVHSQHQPTYPAGLSRPMADDSYSPPSEGTWETTMDMTRH